MKTMTIAIRTTIVTIVLTGLIYPYAMTGLAQALFPWRANGSLVTDEKGQVVGSELIAQGFANPAYFQSRPSAAGEKGYDATSSGGSNLGTTSKKLQDRVAGDLKTLKEQNPDAQGPVPVELVTTSGSGLDPHVSPQGALWQVPRVAKARGVSPERVKAVIDSSIEGRTFGILGEPRVNVLGGQSGARPAVRQSDSAPTRSRKERGEGCGQRGRGSGATGNPDRPISGEINPAWERLMKKIEAIFKPFKLHEIKEVLAKERIPRISLFEVKGAGCHQVRIKQYRGVAYPEDPSEINVARVVEDDEADRIAQTLVTTLRSGELCEGEVAIMPVERPIVFVSASAFS